MQSRRSLLLSLVCVTIIAGSARVLAQAAQQSGASPSKSGTTQQSKAGSSSETNTERTIAGPYRLTYTLTEMDGFKKVGSQRYAVVQDADSHPGRIDISSNVPVTTGAGPSSSNQTYERMQVGVNIQGFLRQLSNGFELTTMINQKEFARDTDNEQNEHANPPPVTRQSNFMTTALLTENKPIVIGMFDIPGSRHTLQVEVELTRVR